MATAAAIRHFERVAASYTRLRDRWPLGALRRQEAQALATLTHIEPGARVLDAGCGDGTTLAHLADDGVRGVGIDITRPMAAQCRRRGFPVCVQDIEQLGFRAAFDWVLCIGSLEFTAEPFKAIRSLAGCLRPSGRLVLLFPRRNLLGHVYAAYHRAHGVRAWRFSRAEVAALLAAT
ncbi:MAG TPA: class I SAM-dependent methyltransferase, partial [Candidatus Kryptonia bacterium]|nr:class I SAM-dependent methyltransferase [Candidatus Kryptonia bacterium]